MAVLRPGEPPGRLSYPRERDPATIHVAALDATGEALSVGGVMSDPHPREPQPGDWRLRGMATREDARGRGLGARVFACCEQEVRTREGHRLWCNARLGAVSFYERMGMSVEGEVFEIAGIGPHYLMSKLLS
jgi:GNAT superfamily N-acetyltransferase